MKARFVHSRSRAGIAAELLLAAAGVAVLAAAALVDGRWVDRHVMLPFFFWPAVPPWLLGVTRAGAAVGGALLLVVVRPRAGRAVDAAPLRAGSLAGALAAMMTSVIAIEAILRVLPASAASGSPKYELKVGQWHPRFGWVSRPSRTTSLSAGGRRYEYAVNALGVRAPSHDVPTDLSRPALVVTGESIASGYGLPYDETFAARCGRDLGLEVVDVAEGGYGLDQAYLRLVDVLPRVQRPRVVVTLFAGPELGRLERHDRPRLVLDAGGALELLPRATGILAGTRLYDVFHNRLAYLDEGALQRSQSLAATLLQAIARTAAARGARPLFVLPSVGPPRSFEQHRERELWRALFLRPGLPHVIVDIPPDDLIPGDYHPGPAGARRIASAIEAALQPAAPLQASTPQGTP
jgi:hypothetical protein